MKYEELLELSLKWQAQVEEEIKSKVEKLNSDTKDKVFTARDRYMLSTGWSECLKTLQLQGLLKVD